MILYKVQNQTNNSLGSLAPSGQAGDVDWWTQEQLYHYAFNSETGEIDSSKVTILCAVEGSINTGYNFTYDGSGNVIKMERTIDGMVQDYEYDGAGNVISISSWHIAEES